MFRQDRTNPSTAVSNWKGRKDTPKAWASTAVSTWLNGGLFGGGGGGVAGYIAGGYTGSMVDTVDKWAFPSDTRTTTTVLPAAKSSAACFADSGVAGYHVGGYSSSWNRTNSTYKMAFPADTWSTGTSYITETNNNMGNQNSGVAGYSSGAGVQGGTYASSTWYRLAFPGDSWSTLTATLSNQFETNGGPMNNNGVACYQAGGKYKFGGSSYVTNKCQKMLVPSESASTTTTLGTANEMKGGCSDNAVAGYVFGGQSSGNVVEKYTFPSDTRSIVTATVSDGYGPGGFSNSGVAGYSAGGILNGFAQTSTVYKIDFTNDSIATTNAMSSGRNYIAGFSDQGVL